jgi:hypothetical protein
MATNRKLLQYFKKPKITFDAFRNEYVGGLPLWCSQIFRVTRRCTPLLIVSIGLILTVLSLLIVAVLVAILVEMGPLNILLVSQMQCLRQWAL